MCRVLAGFSMRSSNTSVLVAGNRKNSGFYAVNCHFFLPNWGGGGGRGGGRRGGREGEGSAKCALRTNPPHQLFMAGLFIWHVQQVTEWTQCIATGVDINLPMMSATLR